MVNLQAPEVLAMHRHYSLLCNIASINGPGTGQRISSTVVLEMKTSCWAARWSHTIRTTLAFSVAHYTIFIATLSNKSGNLAYHTA